MTTMTDILDDESRELEQAASPATGRSLRAIAVSSVITAFAAVSIAILLGVFVVLSWASGSDEQSEVSVASSNVQPSESAVQVADSVARQFPQIEQFSVSSSGLMEENENSLIIMIPQWDSAAGRDLGYEITAFLRENIHELNIAYILWDQHSFSTGGPNVMDDRGSDVSNHRTHINVTVHAEAV